MKNDIVRQLKPQVVKITRVIITSNYRMDYLYKKKNSRDKKIIEFDAIPSLY